MGTGSSANTGIEALEFDYHGFLTSSYLIHSGGKTILVDTGSAVAARDVILPRLSKAGFGSLVAIVDTHSHADHSGGTALLARRTKRPVMIGRTETRWVVDRRLAFRDWFETYRHEVPVTDFMQKEFLADSGDGYPDPVSVEGDMSLDVPSARLVHTPGHSLGSISVFTEEERCLFT